MSIYGLLGQLESKTVLDTMTKEVVGINVPKIAVTRSNTERMDVAVSEIGNTVAAFGAGYLLDKALQGIFKTAQRAGEDALANRWAVVGRSGAIFSAVFALMWAMPFVRNYVTAKRTGSIQFTEVIGANRPENNQNRKVELQQALADYKKNAHHPGVGSGRRVGVYGRGKAGHCPKLGQRGHGFSVWPCPPAGQPAAEKRIVQ